MSNEKQGLPGFRERPLISLVKKPRTLGFDHTLRTQILEGFSDHHYPNSKPPPAYNQPPPPQYSWHGQSYAPQDQPAFPPATVPGYEAGYRVLAPGIVTMAEPPPPDYMTRAILVTVCCFWPIGIFAIMKASESRAAYARGDIAASKENSRSAKQLSNIAIAAGVVSIIIAIILIGVYFGLFLSMMHD